MLRTRFFEIFYLLNAGDRKRFEEMVYSPYFNKNSRVIKLWEHLKANGEEDENLSKANIAKAVFGTERFSDANFRMVIASFVKLVEEYLLHEEYAKNEMERKIRLLEIFQGKNLQKSFRMYLNEIENELDKVKKKDSTYYYRKYFIECIKLTGGNGGDKSAARKFIQKFTMEITKMGSQ